MFKRSIEDDHEEYIFTAKRKRSANERTLYDYRMSLLEKLYPNELVTREAITYTIFFSEPVKEDTLSEYIIPYMKYINAGRKEEDRPYISNDEIENIAKYYLHPEDYKEVTGVKDYEPNKPISSYQNLSYADKEKIYGNHYYWIWKITTKESEILQILHDNLTKIIDDEYKKRHMPRYTIGERINRAFRKIKEMIINF